MRQRQQLWQAFCQGSAQPCGTISTATTLFRRVLVLGIMRCLPTTTLRTALSHLLPAERTVLISAGGTEWEQFADGFYRAFSESPDSARRQRLYQHQGTFACWKQLRSRVHPLPTIKSPLNLQVVAEDGSIANVTAGPFRSCSGGSVFVIDAPLT